MNNNISETIKELRKESGFTVSSLADKCGITVQGLYRWLSKDDEEWNTDSLMLLSKILNFKVIVNGRNIDIFKDNNDIAVDELQRENYSTYKDLDDSYSIVAIYTPNLNLRINEYDKIELVDNFLTFSSKDECEKAYGEGVSAKLYALLSKKTGCIINEDLIDIYPYSIESYYFKELASVIEDIEDGYKIVSKFNEGQIELAKFILEEEKCVDTPCKFGLALFSTKNLNSRKLICVNESIEVLYGECKSLESNLVDKRYFDRNMDEIYEGDILVNKGLLGEEYYEREYLFNLFSKTDLNKYFKKHETIRIKKIYCNELGLNLMGSIYPLDELNLFKWEKLHVNFLDEG